MQVFMAKSRIALRPDDGSEAMAAASASQLTFTTTLKQKYERHPDYA
jgi:hypothetical protein